MPSFKALFPCCFPQQNDEDGIVLRDVDFLETPRSRASVPSSARECSEEETVMAQPGSVEVILITTERSQCRQVPSRSKVTEVETPKVISAIEICESFQTAATFYESAKNESEGFHKPHIISQIASLRRRHSMDSSDAKNMAKYRFPDEDFQTLGTPYESTRNNASAFDNPSIIENRMSVVRRHSLHSSDMKDIPNSGCIDFNRTDMLPACKSSSTHLVQSVSVIHLIDPQNTGLMINYQYVENYVADVVTESMLDQTPNLSHDGEEEITNEMGSRRSCIVDYLDPFNGFESQRVHVSSPRSEYDHWG